MKQEKFDRRYPMFEAEYATNAAGMFDNGKPWYHMHNTFEIGLYIEGKVHAVNGEKKVFFDTPTLLLHRPYTVHTTYSLEEARRDRYIVYFTPELFAGIDQQLLNWNRIFSADFVMIPLNEHQTGRLRNFCMQLRDPENRFLAPFLVACLLNEIETLVPQPSGTAGGERCGYIRDVMRYIEENYPSTLAAEEIARQFAVSVSKLHTDFRGYSQTTVHEFILRVRLEAAARLLRENCSVNEAAFRCGFPNVSHFIQKFRQYYSATPLQYAKSRNNR